MKKLRWLLLAASLCVLGACSNEAGSESPAKPKPVAEEKKEPAKEAKTEPKSDKIEISQFAIDMADETVKNNNPFVEEIALKQKDDTISMAVVIGNAATKESAKQSLEDFVRSLTIGLDGKGPTKDYYGEVYDQYHVLLTAVDPQGNEIITGAMAKGTHRISW
ncbi:hypothetical protein GJU41_12090 [Bacillus idriensis]|uniref:Uncharacterized protein n=1 Tax=Metabacillus idriensis TaxID=324768 RepID=A0A6I2MBI2_9BACI|nr:hypothetical protein [Metabacillus idriensis]MRX54714.1 hypothetical protein [Metabacillus idriensis]